ncbi:hypothetical protein C8Q76DRAFT_793508 [Earliella scabrosa]|nr:hypothetical protein C8Q76DRAFT_793508 [Earliella scabrosa]
MSRAGTRMILIALLLLPKHGANELAAARAEKAQEEIDAGATQAAAMARLARMQNANRAKDEAAAAARRTVTAPKRSVGAPQTPQSTIPKPADPKSINIERAQPTRHRLFLKPALQSDSDSDSSTDSPLALEYRSGQSRDLDT